GGDPAGAWRGQADGRSELLDGLLDDADVRSLVAGIARSGDLGRLARLWVAGLDAAADAAQSGRARRVSLPGYPFARDSYWVPDSGAVPEPGLSESMVDAPAGSAERVSALGTASVAVTVPVPDAPHAAAMPDS